VPARRSALPNLGLLYRSGTQAWQSQEIASSRQGGIRNDTLGGCQLIFVVHYNCSHPHHTPFPSRARECVGLPR